jgi:hypothetical protein
MIPAIYNRIYITCLQENWYFNILPIAVYVKFLDVKGLDPIESGIFICIGLNPHFTNITVAQYIFIFISGSWEYCLFVFVFSIQSLVKFWISNDWIQILGSTFVKFWTSNTCIHGSWGLHLCKIESVYKNDDSFHYLYFHYQKSYILVSDSI